jgi:hypothetical protein
MKKHLDDDSVYWNGCGFWFWDVIDKSNNNQTNNFSTVKGV